MTPDKIAQQLKQDASAYSEGFADGYRLAKKALVTCKECKHRPKRVEEDERDGFNIEFPDDRCPCHCEDGWYNWMPADKWFCGNGERRENVNDQQSGTTGTGREGSSASNA